MPFMIVFFAAMAPRGGPAAGKEGPMETSEPTRRLSVVKRIMMSALTTEIQGKLNAV